MPLSVIAAILSIAALAWLASMNDDWRTSYSVTGKKTDYYNLLVHGFQKGHLYMDVDADPALWSTVPDVRRRAQYLQDASLFGHRYYLYYGVVPAVLLLLPYSSLTGGDLSTNTVTLIFVLAGFLFSLRTYRRAQREHFSGIGPVLDALNVLLLAFATLGPLLVKCSGVYEIAVASGYACAAAAVYFLFRAVHSRGRPLAWLAAASLSLGLAVGCRPDYLFSFPVLLAAALFLVGKSRGNAAPRLSPSPRRILGPLLAAIIPAAAIGGLLALYNYERFGSPLEFGFHYGMNAFTGTGRPVSSVSFIWPNLRWYYLTPPVLAAYFPYCLPINAAALPPGYFSPETIHGQWVVAMLLASVVMGAGVAWTRFRGPGRDAALFLSLLGWMAACGLAFMVTLGVRADRYMIDFQAPLVLLIAMAAGIVASGRPQPSVFFGAWRFVYGLLAVCAVAFNFLISLEIFNNFEYLHPKAFRRLAWIGDLPVYELGELGFVKFGPIRFKATFSPIKAPVSGPLLATGAPNFTDLLNVHQLPNGEMELEMVHEGYVGLRSGVLPCIPGRPYTFEVDMGSLYPPQVSPYFDGWEQKSVDRLKTTARVLVNGKEVIQGRFAFYESSPGMVYLGSNPGENGGESPGRISDVNRLPERDVRSEGLLAEPGIWRAEITVPWLAPYVAHPLLGSGVTGHGNLLLVDVPGPNKLRFGYDQWGVGISQSPALDAVSGVHRLEIFAGPQVLLQKWPPSWHLDPAMMAKSASILNIWWDGKLVWSPVVRANSDSYDLVSLGSNPQGFSTTDMIFPGVLEFKPYSRDEMREFITRNLVGKR